MDKIVYILNKKSNKFLHFDGVAKEIWLLIEKNKSVFEIINSIVDTYDVEFEMVKGDVLEFLNQLYTEGVVI